MNVNSVIGYNMTMPLKHGKKEEKAQNNIMASSPFAKGNNYYNYGKYLINFGKTDSEKLQKGLEQGDLDAAIKHKKGKQPKGAHVAKVAVIASTSAAVAGILVGVAATMTPDIIEALNDFKLNTNNAETVSGRYIFAPSIDNDLTPKLEEINPNDYAKPEEFVKDAYGDLNPNMAHNILQRLYKQLEVKDFKGLQGKYSEDNPLKLVKIQRELLSNPKVKLEKQLILSKAKEGTINFNSEDSIDDRIATLRNNFTHEVTKEDGTKEEVSFEAGTVGEYMELDLVATANMDKLLEANEGQPIGDGEKVDKLIEYIQKNPDAKLETPNLILTIESYDLSKLNANSLMPRQGEGCFPMCIAADSIREITKEEHGEYTLAELAGGEYSGGAIKVLMPDGKIASTDSNYFMDYFEQYIEDNPDSFNQEAIEGKDIEYIINHVTVKELLSGDSLDISKPVLINLFTVNTSTPKQKENKDPDKPDNPENCVPDGGTKRGDQPEGADKNSVGDGSERQIVPNIGVQGTEGDCNVVPGTHISGKVVA